MLVRPLLVLSTLLLLGSATADLAAASERQVAGWIAALTDHRRSINKPAMTYLVAAGKRVLPQLEVLAADPDEHVRSRVAIVAGEIGGARALDLLATLLDDRSAHVREVVVLAIGATGDERAYELIRPRLQDPLPAIRESAALGLGALGRFEAIADLAAWPDAGGNLRTLQLEHGPDGDRQLKRIRVAMQSALLGLIKRPAAVPTIIADLHRLQGRSLEALIEATWSLGDPRLCPVLTELAAGAHRDAQVLAVVGLAANGDSRAVPVLIERAQSSDPELARMAAQSLRQLTGYQAAAGKAWALWWQDNRDRIAALAERDAFIASLHDPDRPVDRAELAAFSPEQLWPLFAGLRGGGAPHWGERAWEILRLDDRERWVRYLLSRYDRSPDEGHQVELVLVLDELGGELAEQGLRDRFDDLQLTHPPGPAAPYGSLRLALRLACDQLGDWTAPADRRKQ